MFFISYINLLNFRSDFEDDTSPKSNNFLDNSDHSCDAVGFKHSDEGQSDHEGQSDQQPEVIHLCATHVCLHGIANILEEWPTARLM